MGSARLRHHIFRGIQRGGLCVHRQHSRVAGVVLPATYMGENQLCIRDGELPHVRHISVSAW